MCRVKREAGTLERHFHQQGASSWDYNDYLAELCGPDVLRTADWRRQMMNETSMLRRAWPSNYRDMWSHLESVEAANAEFESPECYP